MEVRTIVAAVAMAAAAIGCNRPQEGAVRTTTEQGTSNAPGDAALEARDQALVRVVHAMPEVPKADVYTDEKKAFSDVGYGTVTPYKPVAEQRFKFSLKPAGQDTAPAMIEADEGVDAGRRYTILTLPDRGGAAKIDVVTDDVTPPSPGKAKLRVIHAAPEAGTVDVVMTTGDKKESVVDNVDYGSPATYREVDAVPMSFEVQAKGSKGAAIALAQERLEPGKVYTIVVAEGDQPGKPVGLIRIEDQIEPVQAAESDAVKSEEAGKQPAMKKEDEKANDYEIKPDVEGVRER